MESCPRPQVCSRVTQRPLLACLACRSSKVRCELTRGATVCRRCNLRNLKCVYTKSRRALRKSSTSPNTASSPDTNASSSPCSDSSGTHAGISIPHTGSPGSVDDWESNGLFDGESLSQLLVSGTKAISGQPHIAIKPDVLSTYPLDNLLSDVEGLLEQPVSYLAPSKGNVTGPDRKFRTRLPVVSPEDSEYLLRKGALQLLPPALRNELLAAYVKYVHPLLPIIDLGDFLSKVIVGDDTQFKSPLLYQAVMFAGSIFARRDTDEMEQLTGALFERTKVLYEFESEPCAYTQIQALVLMTLWHGDMSRHKGPSYWLDVAFSTAERIGLLHDEDWPCDSRSFRSTMWCCLYVRDRTISLGSRRPPRIPVSIYPDSILHLMSDASQEYDEIIHESLGSASPMLTSTNQEQSAMLFKELVKLSYCVGAILDYLYEGAWVPIPARRSSFYSLAPKCSISPSIRPSCEKLLYSWIQFLPLNAIYHPPHIPADSDGNSTEAVFLVHKAFLYLLYLAAMAVIYRTGTHGQQTSTALPNMEGLRASTSQIKKVLGELQDFGLLPFLPGASVTILMFAVEASLLDLQGSDTMVRRQAMTNLYACEEAALHLMQAYPTAEMAVLKTRTARANLLGLIEA
ncbi:hypothetical protein AtubIFM57143_003735 [Aspergillus tubingensis]|nr:hypothetical protein AtubIFM57143_003735 [Aspergillus tubingensis]